MTGRRLLAGAALLALAACGPDVNSGEVTDKYYEEAYTWYLSQCMPVGQNACGTTIMVPQYEPEHYVITLTNCDLRESSADECPSERHYVDPGTYADAELGDQLDLGEN